MRILLTGASGFIGRHLLNVLLAEGYYVVAAVRKPPAAARARLSYIEADFVKDTDKSVWLARLDGIDVVINTVGIFREHGKQTFATVHSDTPRALFAACVESDDVRMVIQLSALGADQQADSAYHLSKKAADDYLARLPLRSAIVQPSLVYGKDGVSARVFRTLASMPLCARFGDAPQLVQPIHVDDVASAIASLIRRPLPVGPGGATAQRIALVGPSALSFTDYLAALRSGMGLGKLRVLRLPSWCGSALAGICRLVPGSLLNRDALRMLERGSSADPGMTVRLIGRLPRPVSSFIDDPAAERMQARLHWLMPVLRISIAAVWIATAAVSAGLYPVEQSYQLLERTGVPAALAPLMLYGACALDLLIGIGILTLKRRRWLWGAQLLLIGFYTLVIAFRLPEFLLHPYGPLSKNLPMLAAIWLLFELEEK
ncbi:hypothetical protein BN2497_7295 [Janthinobacterium sp. CG23_2]|nr:hypothetical protein BN2497_7295 [Janthinobacterium sp. CG23_2]CUU30045.1 hypothetical protein BN3177_7295 [Janthinobacterium sp. CG23_2]